MPTRAERDAQKDVDMAAVTLGGLRPTTLYISSTFEPAPSTQQHKGTIGDGGAAARWKPDVAEVYSPPRVTAVAA
eukprot:1473826-Heterocapsa_arctica.AAC.1